MFQKKKPDTPDRSRRTLQPPAQRSQVFSYYANRTPRPVASGRDGRDMQDHDQERPKARALPSWQRIQAVLIVGVVLTLLVVNMRLDSHAKVVSIEAPGAIFLRDAHVYEAAARHEFAPLTNTNKLTVNTAAIAVSMQRQFPELAGVTVSLPFIGSQPTLYLQPATPALILTTPQNELYVIDASGRALISGNQTTSSLQDLHLPVVTDQSGLRITLGKVILPRTTVTFISEVVYQLEAGGAHIARLELPSGVGELRIRLKDTNYYVKFNLYGKAREEAGTYLALRKRLAAEHKTPSEYIDVRVENRAYYK